MELIFAKPWYWIIAGALLMGLEIAAPGVFLLWIGLGAMLVGILMAVFPDLPISWQMLLFAAAMLGSIGSGFFIQRVGLRKQSGHKLNQEMNGMIGQSLLAASSFEASRGRVRVGDTTYAALGEDGIQAGDQVRVVDVEGSRLKVVRENTKAPEGP